MNVAAVKVWHYPKHHGHRNREFIFAYTEIETALRVKDIFKLPLRALRGFFNLVFTLMNVPLKSPTYTCITLKPV
uniref:transposase n=1 Tax=Candidatus Enterovibrio escicola TaxID=1927127 RepID=UPI001237AD49